MASNQTPTVEHLHQLLTDVREQFAKMLAHHVERNPTKTYDEMCAEIGCSRGTLSNAVTKYSTPRARGKGSSAYVRQGGTK